MRDLSDATRYDRSVVETNEWAYRICVQDADCGFPYEVSVYHHGKRIGRDYAFTKWGAQLSARRLRRRFFRRERLNGETGVLR